MPNSESSFTVPETLPNQCCRISMTNGTDFPWITGYSGPKVYWPCHFPPIFLTDFQLTSHLQLHPMLQLARIPLTNRRHRVLDELVHLLHAPPHIQQRIQRLGKIGRL